MNVSELHPEEALDLYDEGRLGPRELEMLKAHLARCPSCAAHVQWRSDVQATLSDPLDAAEARRLAAAELGRRGIPAPVEREVRPAASRRQWTMVAAIVAISLVSGAASARFWPSIQRMWHRLSAPSPLAPTPSRTPSHQVALVPATGSATQAPSPPSPPASAPLTRPAPRNSRPAATAAPPRRRRAVDSVAGGEAPAPSPGAVPEAPAPAVDPLPLPLPLDRPSPPSPPASAARLFADVVHARRAGWLSEAHHAYEELMSRFAGSREERTASVLLGQLTLERGQPADALARFEAYLGTDPAGALAEEARLGRALALEQLGHRDDARRAWQEFLQRHSRSLHADRARARLESLGAEPPERQDPPR
jgi:TolA-binding protein